MIKPYLTLGLVGLSVFSASMLFSSYSFADDSVVDEINITVPVSCTMSGTGMNSHNRTMMNGEMYGSIYTSAEDDTSTYDGIGTTILDIFCNDNDGFAVYAAGYTGGEVGGTNSTKLLGTASSNNAFIDTGMDLGNTQDVSNWNMYVYKVKDSDDTSVSNALTIDNGFRWGHVVPNEYVKVAHKNSATDMDTVNGGVKLGTTYFAYISTTQPADTYTGQVIYTLVHPSFADSVGCNSNATTIENALCMQDINSTNKSSIMNSMTLEKQYTLKDKRDGKTYTVAKLKDDNVWMTQNLDLDLDSTKTYTNLDTDIGWNGTGYSTASWTPLRSTYATNERKWCEGGTWDNSFHSCNTNYTPESYDPGDLYWNGVIADDDDDWRDYKNSCVWNNTTHVPTCDETKNPAPAYTTSSSNSIPQYHFGNYYNWAAAIAMNDNSAYNTYMLDANQSICPSGWTLGKSGEITSKGSFQYLFESYGWDQYSFPDDFELNQEPLFYTFNGYWRNIMSDIGEYQIILSSISRGWDYALSAYDVSPDGTAPFSDGVSVRCLLR